MNIEFHTSGGHVQDWVLNYLRDQLMELHHLDHEISRVQVYLKEQGLNKICQVDVTIYGSSLFIRREAPTYEGAVREVIGELRRKIDELVKKQNEPPDEVTTSVKV